MLILTFIKIFPKLKLKLPLLILFFVIVYQVFSQEIYSTKKHKAKGNTLHWLGRSLVCNTACVFAYCDKKSICPDYILPHEVFVKVWIPDGFYVKNGKLWLKNTYKKYFVGNTTDARVCRVLTDANDRLVILIYPKPNYLGSVSEDSNQVIKEFICKPISKADIMKTDGDVEIDKLPLAFNNEFELCLFVAPYCSKELCAIWRYEDTHAHMKKYVLSTPYPILSLLVDTSFGVNSVGFKTHTSIKLRVPLESQQGISTKDARLLIDTLDEPPFNIKKATLFVNPILTTDSVTAVRLAFAKANVFLTSLSSHPYSFGFAKKIEVENSWEKFKEKVVLTPWYRLADSSRIAVAKELSNNNLLVKSMTPFLNDFYSATLSLDIVFDSSKTSESEYWIFRIKKAANDGKLKNALGYQKSLLRLVNENKILPDQALIPELSFTAGNIVLLNNQYAIQRDYFKSVEAYRIIYELDRNNAQTKYNLLASELNVIRDLPHSDVYDGMLKNKFLFTRINASSIPVEYYSIIKARFYPLETEDSDKKKTDVYNDLKYLYSTIPPSEVMILSDDYAEVGRFDIATNMLFDRFKDVPLADSSLNMQYVVRLMYYGKKSGFIFSDSYYELMLDKIYRFNPDLLKFMFEKHELSYTLLNNKVIRRKYLRVSRKTV
jgi:hypothetical protein